MMRDFFKSLKSRVGYFFVFFILTAALLTGQVYAVPTISSTSSGWTRTIDSTDLQSGAGSEINQIIDSATNQTLVVISGCKNKWDNYRVDVRYTYGGTLPFQIWIKRTGTGTGSNGTAVSGGDTFLLVTTSDQTFFNGNGDRNNIPIQYEIQGCELTDGTGTYSNIIIVLTCVNTP
ncbi:MAG: hypothetical protein RDV48_28070 [Candidatus Eremiobacteraeota bacterium]|nr:hypothetical protein [Candidatus Eremiobacteraeota bacterium]